MLALPASYDDHGGAFWVALDADGALLGTAGVYPVGEGTYELREMYLRGATRGRGVGKRLFVTARGWVAQRGGQRIVIDATEQMDRAIAFYESAGLIRDGDAVTARRRASSPGAARRRAQWMSRSPGAPPRETCS